MSNLEEALKTIQTEGSTVDRFNDLPDYKAPKRSKGVNAEAELLRDGIAIRRGGDWLGGMKPVEWLVRGLFVRGYLYTFTSPTNHGKTTVMAHIISRCLMGLDIGGCKNGVGAMNVLLLCGENDIDTAHKMQGAINANAIPKDALVRFFVIDKAFSIGKYGDHVVEAANALGVEFHLVVADTWQAYWSGGDFNSNEAQLEHAKAMRVLTTIRGRPTVVVPAHPVKNASKDNLVPYGGGAAMNELDGNFEGWNDSGIFTMGLGKKRQPDMGQISFEIMGVTLPQLPDADGSATPTAIAMPISESTAEKMAVNAEYLREQVMRTIGRILQAGERPTRASIALELGLSEGKVRHPIDVLSGAKGSKTPYIKTGPISLTKAGIAYLKEIKKS